jgi:hypothetical protein
VKRVTALANFLSPDAETSGRLLGKFRQRNIIFQIMKYRTLVYTLHYKGNVCKEEILDARYYSSRKHEHLIKTKGYSVTVVASTGE